MRTRYYYPPPRRAGLHGRRGVPVAGFGQTIEPGQLTAIAAQICAAAGGSWTGNECVMPGGQAPPPGTTVGTGFPPGTVPTACGPSIPCPAGSTCMPTPAQIAPFLPGVSSICMPDGATLPTQPPGPGTGPPPSMPPQTQPPQTQPPGLPPPPPKETETPAKSLFGLPPVAVYIGIGALGLLAVAAVAKKSKRRR